MEYAIVFILLIFSALFSGLTLGLMSLSAHELKRKAELGDMNARKVYPVRKHGNLLLTTLLIGNVAVNAVLSVFLGSITSGVVAVVAATILIVIFGEIVPQAIFSRYALALGARVAWLVQVLIWIFYVVSKPIATILDKTLGEELPTVYSKRELAKIIEEHEDAQESDLDEDEERIMKGALTFSDKKVRDVMTPRTVVYAFEEHDIVDETLLDEVRESGASRFPVYREEMDHVVGMLYSWQLIGEDNIGATVGDIAARDVRFIRDDASLDDALRMFLQAKKHLSIVRDEFGGMAGVLTLDDVLEEIIRTEIVDESDKHEDMRAYAREHNGSAAQP